MPRKGGVTKRKVPPDPRYGSELVTKFINFLMRRGKRSVAESIFCSSMDTIQEKIHQPPLKVFREAVENVKPILEVKSRRIGGATYQVPIEVRPERRTSLAIRWIIHNARLRRGKSMREKLALELIDASKGEGGAIKKKEDTHRMAEANKAFAHYRW